jgi:hypothetical protein
MGTGYELRSSTRRLACPELNHSTPRRTITGKLQSSHQPGFGKAKEFFGDTPPNCDPRKTCLVGVFLHEHLLGIADFLFDFLNL